mmetsp:Transcript_71808/g.208014  ORF Transcript_71808/g.208014 Transcript_71808/m.208014 type:complete len:357 (+) Transcript_71808:109-1179(+)
MGRGAGAAVFSALLAGAAVAQAKTVCPVLSCGPGAGQAAALAQQGDDGEAPRLATESETPCQEVSNYTISYSPGHFTCMSCDPGSCEGCAVLCDLSSCVGEFYTQECWCDSGSGGGGGSKSTVFCGSSCHGGVCDTPGYMCEPREKECQPWWWCGAPPPKSFLQERSSLRRASSHETRASTGVHRASATASASARASSLSMRLRTWRRRAGARSGQHKAPELPSLHFKPGRFVCESGALPPKTRDPQTLLWLERGYIVLDKRSCEGSLFEEECYCWDEFKRLKGKDPFTSQFKCDASCKWGSCEGRTCGKKPPPVRKPEPQMSSPAQLGVPDSVMNVVMEPAHDPALPQRIVRGET